MNGPITKIRNPEDDDVKTFSFDYSYWSHDGFVELDNGYLDKQGNAKYIGQVL